MPSYHQIAGQPAERLAKPSTASVSCFTRLPPAICRRILIGQALYAFGAARCVFKTLYSIAFIVLVQLNYAVAPRFRSRSA